MHSNTKTLLSNFIQRCFKSIRCLTHTRCVMNTASRTVDTPTHWITEHSHSKPSGTSPDLAQIRNERMNLIDLLTVHAIVA